jgi:hypothetical protein
MKRIIGLVFVLLLSFALVSDAIVILRTRGVTCDDCSGDLKWSWHMEDMSDTTAGTPCGCTDGGGDTVPVLSGSGSYCYRDDAQKSDGTYSLRLPSSAAYDFYEFNISNDIELNDSEGRIVIDIYVDTWADSKTFFYAHYLGSQNFIQLKLEGAANDIEAQAIYTGNSSGDAIKTAGTGHVENEWLRITYRWDIAKSGVDHIVEICDLTPPDTTSNCADSGLQDDLAAWNDDATELQIGMISSGGATLWIDNVEIWGDSEL